MPITIATERLTIHPLNLADSAFVLSLVNTREWIRFIGDKKVYTPLDAQKYVRGILADPDRNYWTVRIKEGDHRIGLLTLIKRDYLEFKDLGFAFLPEFHGRGYASESASALLNHLRFESTDQMTLFAITIPSNLSSIGLLTRLGFTYHDTITVEHELLHTYKTSITP